MLKRKGLIAFAILTAIFAIGAVMSSQQASYAHCQIPCGIYGDDMRFHMLHEHITTMEKSINLINDLSGESDGQSINQLGRWIMNKDAHADEFAEIILKYFLQQRLKPTEPGADGYDKYIKELTLCHELVVGVMKVKQNADVQYTAELTKLLNAFNESYAS